MGLLVTTALENTWGEEPIIFLGEWCRRYERSAIWQARDHTVVRYHWDDRVKLRKDHEYLRSLHDQMLPELARRLGKIHHLERPLRFWRILLDPWLSRYLAVVFDRWETLRIAFEEYRISKTVTIEPMERSPVRNQLEFIDAVTGDQWNHELCADIISFEYRHRCEIRRTEPLPGSRVGGSVGAERRAMHWKRRMAYGVDRILVWCGRRNALVLVRPYFPMRAFLRLSFRLRQIPCFYLREFEWPEKGDADLDRSMTDVRAIGLTLQTPAGSFGEFLGRRIGLDLPQAFLELFAGLGRRAAAIRLRPKAILTANDHANNDFFKRWVAHNVMDGAPFVIMEHGSGIPPLFSALDCEEQMSDVKTTWSLPYKPRQLRLPANKLAGRRQPEVVGERLIVVGQEMPRYAFDALSMAIAGQTLTGVEFICRLHEGLSIAAQQALLVKPYPDLGWRTRDRFVDRLGASKVSVEPNLDRLMRTARIVVCTYPQTTFSEAMVCGAPALLLYPRHLWETEPQFDGLLDVLRAAGIMFVDPSAAAEHINRIWADPLAWWQSPRVRGARQQYEAEALDMNENWIDPWARFAEGLLADRREKNV